MSEVMKVPKEELSVYERLLMSKASERTREAYADDLRHFAEFLGIPSMVHIPNKKDAWHDLDPALIAAYLEMLKHRISEHTGRPYATATIARRVTAVKELLTEATYLGLYPRDQLDYIRARLELPEVTSEHHGGISPDEQDRLLNVASQQPGLKGSRDYGLLRLWMDTGLRRAEIVGLTVRDLTVKEGISTLIVRHGKGNRTREIGLEGYTAYCIEDWLKTSGQNEYRDYPMFCQVRKVGQGTDATYIVINPEKHLLSVALNQLVAWYCKQACIRSKVTPHSFRVAMVTDMLDGGAPIQHVQKVAGHTTTRMISEIYDRNLYAEPVARYRKRTLPRRQHLTQ